MRKWKPFARWTWQTILTDLCAALIMSVMVAVKIPGKNKLLEVGTVSSYLAMFAVYVIMISMFVTPLMVGSVYSNYIPVCIGMNLRRKDAIRGVQAMKVVSAAFYVILAAITMWAGGWPLSEGRAKPVLLLFLGALCVNIMLISISEIMVLIYQRYRKWGIIIMIIFFAAIGGAMGIFLGSSMEKGIMLSIDFSTFSLPVWIVILAVVIWVLDIVISKKLLNKLEIHS